MGDKGEGGVKNLKKWVMSFMDGPLKYISTSQADFCDWSLDFFFLIVENIYC